MLEHPEPPLDTPLGGTDDMHLCNIKRLTSSPIKSVHFDLIDMYCGTALEIIEMATSREYSGQDDVGMARSDAWCPLATLIDCCSGP